MSARDKNSTSLGPRNPREQFASPTKADILVQNLFRKSCSLLKNCLVALEKNEQEVFLQSSLHAFQILMSLRFVVDTSKHDSLSANIYTTYTSIAASLLRARRNKDRFALKNIYEALVTLKEAWDKAMDFKVDRPRYLLQGYGEDITTNQIINQKFAISVEDF